MPQVLYTEFSQRKNGSIVLLERFGNWIPSTPSLRAQTFDNVLLAMATTFYKKFSLVGQHVKLNEIIEREKKQSEDLYDAVYLPVSPSDLDEVRTMPQRANRMQQSLYNGSHFVALAYRTSALSTSLSRSRIS